MASQRQNELRNMKRNKRKYKFKENVDGCEKRKSKQKLGVDLTDETRNKIRKIDQFQNKECADIKKKELKSRGIVARSNSKKVLMEKLKWSVLNEA